MGTFELLNNLAANRANPEKPMPVFFIGHGSPMNGIEENEFSHSWVKLGEEIPTPAAVLCVSAHWLTKGTFVTAMEKPKTIHDFGGFPKELFDVQYPAPGNPQLALETVDLIKETNVGFNHDWGLDHGTWTVVRHMYPDAKIPVLQLSVDYQQPAAFHYKLGTELAELRKKGALIIGSGNMVHNLRMVAWDKMDEPGFGYDWALEMNDLFKKNILSSNHKALIDYEKFGETALKAIPTPDHYFPLLYTLGLQTNSDEIEIFNDKAVGGSLTMTSVKIG
jgi:4,5-DOPA dioxygenase extradiol